jgi:hypothetical protein
VSVSYSSEVLADSPLAYWKFDEAPAYALDSGSNASPWTYGASVTPNKTGLLSDGGTAVSGNGSNPIATLPSVPSGLTGGNVTLEAWVKLPTGNLKGSFVKVGSSSNGWGMGIGGTQWDNAGRTLVLLTETIAWNPTSYSFPNTAGVYHVMVVRGTGNAYTCYVNGTAVATGNLSSPVAASGQMGVGGYTEPYGFKLSSTIDVDNVAVYASALSSTRVTAHYNSGSGDNSAVTADSPVVWLKLDEASATGDSGATAADSSGNSRTLTHFSPAFGQPSLLGDGSGYSVAYNGTTHYSAIASASWMNVSTAASGEIRLKADSAALTGQQFIASRWTSGGNRTWLWSINGAKAEISILISGTTYTVTGSTTLVAGSTYTIGWSYDGTTLRLYVNGVQDGSLSVSGSLATISAPIEIARAAAAVYGAVKVDELSHYGSVLSAARFLAHHNAAISSGHDVDGTVAGTLPALTASSTGDVTGPPVTGTVSGTLPALTGSIDGTHTSNDQVGTVAGTLPALSASATGTVHPPPVTGTVTGTLPALTGDVAGVVPIIGVVDGILPALTGYASDGGGDRTGTVVGVLPALGGNVTGLVSNGLIGQWTGDQSQAAVVQVEPTGGPLTILPPIAGPPPIPFVERSITRVSHLMDALAPDENGRVHADGTHEVIYEEVGVPHLFIGGRDVTYFRGVPVIISEWSSTSPGGDEIASIEFPQVTPWDTLGTGDLEWLRPDAAAEIYLVKDGERVLPAMFCGSLVSDNVSITESDLRTGWHLEGVISEADNIGHHVPMYLPPTDRGVLMAKALNDVISRTYGNVKPVITGMTSRQRGQYDDTELDYVQAVSDEAWSDDNRQWTVMRGPSPRTLKIALKDMTTVHHVLTAGAPGVEIDLTADQDAVRNVIYGRGRTPEGGSWANWKFPGLRDTAIPDYPYSSAGTVMSIGSTDAGTLTGEGVSLVQERLRALGYKQIEVDGTFRSDDAGAVEDVQGRFGLLVDGIVGPQTWNGLFESGIDAGNFNNPYRAPLAFAPVVEPYLYTADGGKIGRNPLYFRGVKRRELQINYGTNITKAEATVDARKRLARLATPGWVGTITLRGSDPHGGSRFLMFENQNVQILGWRGGNVLLHIIDVRKSNDEDGTVVLTVDSKARDTMSLAATKERDRDAQADPGGRPGNLSRRSSGEQDIAFEWDDDSGAGVIEERALYPGLPAMVRVPVSQVGALAGVKMQTRNSRARFSVSIWGAPIQPTQFLRGIGNPLTKDDPYGDADDAFLAKHGFIEGWGQLGQAAGYGKKSEAGGAPVTGELIEAADLKYRSLAGALVWAIIIADRPCFFRGRLYPDPVV